MPQRSSNRNVHDRKLRVFDVENKAALLESVAVQANAKTVPTCNATNVGGTDISPANVETMRLETSTGRLEEPQAGRQPRNK